MNGTAGVCIYVQMVDTRYIYLPRKMCNFEHYGSCPYKISALVVCNLNIMSTMMVIILLHGRS